jgi:hypothetical protein
VTIWAADRKFKTCYFYVDVEHGEPAHSEKYSDQLAEIQNEAILAIVDDSITALR